MSSGRSSVYASMARIASIARAAHSPAKGEEILIAIFGSKSEFGKRRSPPLDRGTFAQGETKLQEYDYASSAPDSAGCVIARRLTDDPNVRVLLLEAGPPANGFWVEAPAGMARLFKDKRYNWSYFTEPVPTLRDRRLYWPRGKALGGSSAINGLVYVRGNRGDFDHWAQLGETGWVRTTCCPISSGRRISVRGERPAWRGGSADGQRSVDQTSDRDRFRSRPPGASASPRSIASTARSPEAAGFLSANIRNGVRQSSYDAFLAPVRDRANLDIQSGAHVRRILFQDRKAVGVEVFQAQQIRQFSAKREVIVSAGALNSPQVSDAVGHRRRRALQLMASRRSSHLAGRRPQSSRSFRRARASAFDARRVPTIARCMAGGNTRRASNIWRRGEAISRSPRPWWAHSSRARRTSNIPISRSASDR